MALTIPDHFSQIRTYIEKRYKVDEIFRDIYNDYLTYLDTHRFWSHSSMDVALDRRREYAELVSELEKELMEMLKKGSDEEYKTADKTGPKAKRRENNKYE